MCKSSLDRGCGGGKRLTDEVKNVWGVPNRRNEQHSVHYRLGSNLIALKRFSGEATKIQIQFDGKRGRYDSTIDGFGEHFIHQSLSGRNGEEGGRSDTAYLGGEKNPSKDCVHKEPIPLWKLASEADM